MSDFETMQRLRFEEINKENPTTDYGRIRKQECLDAHNNLVDKVRTALQLSADVEAGRAFVMRFEDIEKAPKDNRYIGIIEFAPGQFGEPFLCEWDEDEGHVCRFQTEIAKHIPTHYLTFNGKPDIPTPEESK